MQETSEMREWEKDKETKQSERKLPYGDARESKLSRVQIQGDGGGMACSCGALKGRDQIAKR